MILGILFLLGGAACTLMAFRRLRGMRDPGWVQSEDTRLVISPAQGQDEPRVTLWRGDGIAFGPCWATWDPPQGMKVVSAPLPGSGSYRVAAAVDLGADDPLGTGDARLANLLRDALGSQALVLLPSAGDRPVLLHGTTLNARGSATGIGVEEAHLAALVAMLGDPVGLRVDVVRRRVQRGGWGSAQDQRQRGRN